jgi:hypothetical protein
MADIRALVFNSGTFRREELSKKSERELWQLWEADGDQAQVQMFYLDEFSCAFNDEEVSDQDWLYFVDLDNIKQDDPLAEYSEDYRKGIAYVKEQLDEDDLTILRAQVSKNYKQHNAPATGIDDSKVIDLLEEYGEDNDLPEGWYLDEYDADEVMLML